MSSGSRDTNLSILGTITQPGRHIKWVNEWMNHAHAGSNLSRVLHGKAYVMCYVSAFLMFGFFRWLPRPSREPRLKPRAISSHKCVPQIVSVADTTFHGFGMKKQKAKGAPTSICLHKLDIYFFSEAVKLIAAFPPCPALNYVTHELSRSALARTIADLGFMLLKEMSSSLKLPLDLRDCAICAAKVKKNSYNHPSSTKGNHSKQIPLVRG